MATKADSSGIDRNAWAQTVRSSHRGGGAISP